jgi:RNA polymerase sigma-70 factor (ECF subfamily)
MDGPAKRSAGFITQHAPSTSRICESWDWTRLRAVALQEAQRTLGRTDAAQDAAQESVLRAWRYAHRCRTADRPEAWLRVIARREALRVRARAPAHAPLQDHEPAEPSHEERVTARVDLQRAMAGLTAGEREAIVRRYWYDVACEDIARQLGCPLGTVKIRLHRGRNKLRGRLME